MPYLSPETMWFYSPTAFDIPQEHIINVAAVAQKWIDQVYQQSYLLTVRLKQTN